MGGGDVAEVEWRILAHQHHVDVAAEVEDGEFAEREVIAGFGADTDFVRASIEPAVGIGQGVGEIVIELVAARLGGKHDREGRNRRRC